MNFDISLDELYAEYIKAYQSYSSLERVRVPYIEVNPLFSSFKYKKITNDILQNFFSIYLKHKHNKFATCYQLSFTDLEVKELNKKVSSCLYNGNKNMAEIIHIFVLTNMKQLDNLITKMSWD